MDVAARQLAASGKEPSSEGISLITNIETTEVRNVASLNAGAKFGQAAQEAHPLPTALAAWHTDVKYTGPYGVVRDLLFAQMVRVVPIASRNSRRPIALVFLPKALLR